MTHKTKAKSKVKITVIFIALLIIFLFMILVYKIFSSTTFMKNYYEVEPRIEEVEKSKQEDTGPSRTVGWLRVQGTNIDLPIVFVEKGKRDIDSYPVEKEKYVWLMDRDDKFHNKILISGHNIFNLSAQPKIDSAMFKRLEELMAFVYYDFAKENKYFQITLDGKEYLYQIFAVDFAHSSDIKVFPDGDNSKSDIKKQIKMYKDDSLYDYDVDVDENDKIATVITCTRFFGEYGETTFGITGKLIDKNGRNYDYKVTKSKKYEEIEKKLKGDDEDETDSV